jgi:hypothetical protein
MAHGVNAAVKGDQPAGAQPVPNGVLPEAELAELPEGDNAVLVPRQLPDQPIRPI